MKDKHMSLAFFCIMVVQLFVFLTAAVANPVQPVLSPEEKLRLGEQMYRQGILPSGEPMTAFVKGDLPVLGTAFTCVSCHQRSGLGSVEGEVYTPPTNGAELFKPVQRIFERTRRTSYPKNYPLKHIRPEYTDETLADVLRTGVDPSGRILGEEMPRYELGDEDMAIMIFYLKSLSSQYSPGASAMNIHFATVITDDVSQKDRDAMLLPLLGFIESRNNQTRLIRNLTARADGNFQIMAMINDTLNQPMSLSIWQLHGPAETWRSQLEEYYSKDPVFALIGGISKGEWKPIHQFSEDHRIPCLFPDTDFPVISRTDWYTLYMSKGYYQEGEAAARYLNGNKKIVKGGRIVQVVRDSREGRALSTGFQETWQELGHGVPVTHMLKPGEELTKGAVEQLLAKEKPVALVLWDGSATLPELEVLGGVKKRPPMVIVSSSYLGKSLWSLKDEVRDFTYVTYPFRLPQSVRKKGTFTNPVLAFSDDATKEGNQSYTINQVLTLALMHMKNNYYRDNLLDIIGMLEDMYVPLYERLSFGPGQRYASKGCYIVQLSKGEKPTLIQKSDWVIH